MKVITLQSSATTTATGSPVSAVDQSFDTDNRAYQATVSGTGAVTATVVIEVSLDGSNWLTLGTITLSGTTSATDGFASSAPWAYVRSRVSAITGTSATVNCYMGV